LISSRSGQLSDRASNHTTVSREVNMWQRWGPGPVFIYETLLNARRWQVYAARSLFVLVILMGMIVVWIGSDPEVRSGQRPPTYQELARLGWRFFYTMAGVQLSLVMLAAPAAAAGSICMDRVRGTLAHMLMTDLSDVEIVLGKFAARLAPVVGMIVCAVPVAALATLLGGIEFRAIAGLFIVSLSLAVLGCVLALTISVWATRTHEVLMAVYMIVGLWLMSLPIWYMLSFGGKMRAPPSWFQKANPYVLVFAPYAQPGFATALDHAVFGGIVLAIAAGFAIVSIARLRRVIVAQASRREPARGRRLEWRRLFSSWPGPTLDGSPVLWREWHYNRPSRLAWWLWTALLGVCWCLLAWGTYEAAGQGLGSGGPNGFSVAMLLVLFFGFLLLSATAPTALAEERARGSLDVLLTTPLSAREIMIAKWWGVYRRVIVLALVPFYGCAFMAAAVPELPNWSSGRTFTPALVPVTNLDRVLAASAVGADFLASGAVLVSLGLLLATWVRRLSRAVTLSVIAYFIAGIGWFILVQALFEWWLTTQRPDSINAGRWLVDAAMSASPVFGPARPIDMLFNGEQYSRTPHWVSIGVVILLKAVVAGLLLRLSIKTFDRCMGRVPESQTAAASPRFRTPSIGPKLTGTDDLALARAEDGFRD
jgi:ABC-type transport system involved in multi-copper enzyme maturation permease subunit